MSEQMISMDLIDPPVFNSRIGYEQGTPAASNVDSLDSLAASMKSEGLKAAIEVEPVSTGGAGTVNETYTGRYVMVFGSRRYRAAKILGWTEIRANVVEPTKPLDRVLSNGIENLQRENLSTFEQARLFARLREEGLKLRECAARTGVSPSKIGNYAGCMRLPQTILDAWQASAPAATMEFLIELSAYKGETEGEVMKNQLEAWSARVGLLAEQESAFLGSVGGEDPASDEEEDDDSDAAKRKPGIKPPPYKVTPEWYKHLAKTLKAKRSLPGASFALQVLDLALGRVTAIKGLTSRAEFDDKLKEKDPKSK